MLTKSTFLFSSNRATPTATSTPGPTPPTPDTYNHYSASLALGTAKDIATSIDIISVGAEQINLELKDTLERLSRVVAHQRTTLHASQLTKVALENVLKDSLREIAFTIQAVEIGSQLIVKSHDNESPSSIVFREKMMKGGFHRMSSVKSKLLETGELLKINHSLVNNYDAVHATLLEVNGKLTTIDGMIAAYLKVKDTASKEQKQGALGAAKTLLEGIFASFRGIQLK